MAGFVKSCGVVGQRFDLALGRGVRFRDLLTQRSQSPDRVGAQTRSAKGVRVGKEDLEYGIASRVG